MLGTSHIIAPALDSTGELAGTTRASFLVAVVTTSFFALEAGAYQLLRTTVPDGVGANSVQVVVIAVLRPMPESPPPSSTTPTFGPGWSNGASTSPTTPGSSPASTTPPPTMSSSSTTPSRRSTDWAQVRPEWGQSGGRAFILALRSRTEGRDLAGYSFLHSHDWRQDDDFGVLQLVMTAPIVV